METNITDAFNKKIMVKLLALHDGQIVVANSTARFKVLSAGRRWGKTRLGVWLCLEKAWKGGRAWWVAPTYAMALEGWKDLRQIGIEHGVIVKEAERTIITTTGGSVSVRSADAPDRLRGAGLDFIVLDECAYMKEQTWREVLRPTLTERQGGALFISTPRGFNWFEKLYTDSKKLDDWERWQLPTITNPFVPESELEIAKKEIGSYLYSQEYEAKFVELSGGMFQANWFNNYKRRDVTVLNDFGMYEEKTEFVCGSEKVYFEKIRRIATVDLATSTKQTADYTVIAVLGVTPKNNIIVLDLVRKRLEAPDIIPLLQKKQREWELDYIGIERAGYQLAFIQLARRNGLIVKELKADKDKVSRAYPLSAKLESGQVFFNKQAQYYDDLEREMLQFPDGEHDDQVDALAYGIVETQQTRKIKAY